MSPEEGIGYYIKDFEEIIEDISNQGIKVKTLSEFDNDNGISQNELIIKEGIPEQIILNITVVYSSLLSYELDLTLPKPLKIKFFIHINN